MNQKNKTINYTLHDDYFSDFIHNLLLQISEIIKLRRSQCKIRSFTPKKVIQELNWHHLSFYGRQFKFRFNVYLCRKAVIWINKVKLLVFQSKSKSFNFWNRYFFLTHSNDEFQVFDSIRWPITGFSYILKIYNIQTLDKLTDNLNRIKEY